MFFPDFISGFTVFTVCAFFTFIALKGRVVFQTVFIKSNTRVFLSVFIGYLFRFQSVAEVHAEFIERHAPVCSTRSIHIILFLAAKVEIHRGVSECFQLVDIHRIRIFCSCRYIDNLAGTTGLFIADGYGTFGGHKFAENLSVPGIQIINRFKVRSHCHICLLTLIRCFFPCLLFLCKGFFIFFCRFFGIRNAGLIDFVMCLPLRVYSIMPCFGSIISPLISFPVFFPALVFFRFPQVRCHFFRRLSYGSRHISDKTCST